MALAAVARHIEFNGDRMYTCPVCGYGQLSEPPTNFAICPRCGTELEYDDVRMTHAQLRAAWLEGGAHWWSPVDPQPPNWDPYAQLNAIIQHPPILDRAV